MSKKINFIAKLISRIDDDIIDRNTEKRIRLMARTTNLSFRRKKWIPLVAAAACMLLVFGSVFGWLIRGGGKQVPVYQGMTVSYDTYVSDSSSDTDTMKSDVIPLGAFELSDSCSVPLRLGKTDNKQQIVKEQKENKKLAPSVDGRYYAMKNEDIYIHVHLSNPDGFEILSFTINGEKYSSYMFESGSDLETLILKYNVGNVSGLQEYTIDAIKYVDGEKIKDARMDGDRTIEVYVNDDADGDISFNAELSVWDLTIDPRLPSGVGGFTSLALYDGNQKISDYSPTTTYFANLPSGKRLTLIGKYSFEGKELVLAHTFETPKESEGLIISNGKIVGMGSCTDNVLYLNMPIDNRAFAEQKGIREVYIGSGVTSIGENAFAHCSSLEKVTFAEGITKIGDGTFAGCSALESIELPDSVTTIGSYLFSSCSNLSSVTIGSGVTEIEESNGFNIWHPETGDYRPIPSIETFAKCPLLSSVTFKGTTQQWLVATKGINIATNQENTIIIHCSDGDLLIEPYK